MYPSHDVIAWTPRVKGETIKRAGYRLVHAFMLEILMVKDGEWQCDPDFAGGILPTYLREDYRKLARIVPKGTPWPKSTWG